MSVFKVGKTGTSSKAYPIFSRISGLRRLAGMLSSLKRFSGNEVAQERLRIINFYSKRGELATKEAFKVDRKLVYVWKKRLKASRGKLSSLIPFPTAPKTVRQMRVHPLVVEHIRKLREEHFRLGKEKIKPLLDEYCLRNNLPTIAEPTIGKVIKRHHLYFQKQGRIYHHPSGKWALNQAKKTKRLRVKHPPKHQDLGHIQSDTVEQITEGIKEYFYSAIDARLKFSLTLNYKSLNSKNNQDFYQKFKSVYPGVINDWQSDNGLENLGEFEKQLKKDKILHYFTYPRCPKINGVVERYQRTFQEEFLYPNLHLIHDKITFNKELAEYLIFYNTKRPHKSLGNKSPMDYLITEGLMSKKTVSYTSP
jgi:transposase InsO family protein